jgi:hypothetical protein
MVPIWKRKWERLPNVDGQHSRPSSISTFKNDTASKQSNQLDSKYYAKLNQYCFISVTLMDFPVL